MKCPNCKLDNEPGRIRCATCGAKVPQQPEAGSARRAGASAAGGADYEPFGDEWRREVMKLTKAQIVDVLRDVARNRSVELGQPTKSAPGVLSDGGQPNMKGTKQ